MQVGDRILIKSGPTREVLIIARVEIPHSPQRAFASKSGAPYSIGRKVWKSDYVWSEKSKMWVPRE